MSKLSRSYKPIFYFAGSILVVALPWIANGVYARHIMIMSCLAIVLAAANRIVLVSGAWFMGQAAFYAIGAYGLVLLRTKAGLNFWIAFPLAGFMAALVALVLGYATSRVKGMHFCLITIAFVEVVRLTIIKIPFLGGHRALTCPPPESILGIDFSSKIHYYYFILFLTSITLGLLQLIEKSPTGAVLKTIAENESLAESVGINTARYKVSIMAVCTFFAGLAGAFYAPYVAVTGPTSFTLTTSVIILIHVVVGGMESIWGPVVGAVFLTLLPELLPNRASYQNILYAAIVLSSLFFLPDGLIGLPQLIGRKFGLRTISLITRRQNDTSSS